MEWPSRKEPGDKQGDENLRSLERAVQADPNDPSAQDRLFSWLNRKYPGDPAAVHNEVLAVLQRVDAVNCQANLDAILESAGLRGAMVEVQEPVVAGATMPVKPAEKRWEQWNIRDKDGKELAPCRIEKVVRVELQDKPWQTLVDAGGYDWKNDKITEAHFPVGTPQDILQSSVESYIVRFDGTVTTKEVIAWLDANGLEAARLKQLLAIGEQHRDEQRRIYLVGLGQTWQETDKKGKKTGPVFVSALGGFGRGRSLNLPREDDRWGQDGGFPAARKKN